MILLYLYEILQILYLCEPVETESSSLVIRALDGARRLATKKHKGTLLEGCKFSIYLFLL